MTPTTPTIWIMWPKGRFAPAAVAYTRWDRWRIALRFGWPFRRVIVAPVLDSALHLTPPVVAQAWEEMLRNVGRLLN